MAGSNLTPDQVKQHLKSLVRWQINPEGQLVRLFEFKSYPQALLFVNAIGWLAEKANHHPDLLVQWGKVHFSVFTHDTNGLTERDFRLAKEVDELFASTH